MNIPSERVQKESTFEARVSGNQFPLLTHRYPNIVPQHSRVGTSLICLFEYLKRLFYFSSLQANRTHSNQTVVLLSIRLECQFEILVGDVDLSHLAAANAQ